MLSRVEPLSVRWTRYEVSLLALSDQVTFTPLAVWVVATLVGGGDEIGIVDDGSGEGVLADVSIGAVAADDRVVCAGGEGEGEGFSERGGVGGRDDDAAGIFDLEGGIEHAVVLSG